MSSDREYADYLEDILDADYLEDILDAISKIAKFID